MIRFEIEIDDKKGTNQIIPISATRPRDPIFFKWVDDIDYICDWAVFGFSQPLAVISQGYDGDGYNIPPLMGTETIKVTFGDDVEKDKGMLELEMDIFRIQEKPPNPAGKFMMTKLVLINSKVSKLIAPEKNRSIPGSYSSVAEKIALEAGFKKENLIIEETQGSKGVKQLYWNDSQLLSDMADNSVGSQGGVPYFWHVSGDNFHFHSYEYPQEGEKYHVSQIYGPHVSPAGKSESDLDEFRRSQVLDWMAEVSPKANLFGGGAGMTAGGSSFDSGYIMKQKRGDDIYSQGSQLDTRMPTDSLEMDDKARYVYTGGDSDNLENYIKNKVAMRQKRMVTLTVFMRGKAERRAGRIVEFEHMKMSHISKESKYSGEYMVKRVEHMYHQGEYYNQLTLTRSGYNL